MAYCRFSEGDVYLYPSTGGVVECCACRLSPKVPTILTKGGDLFGSPVGPCSACGGEGCEKCMMHGSPPSMSYTEAINHVKRHIAAGHVVPSGVIESLRCDQVQFKLKG